MKTSISDLISRASRAQADYDNLLRNLSNNHKNISVRELDGKIQALQKYDNFQSTFDSMENYVSLIAKIKGVIAEKNATIKLSNGLSIAQNINLLSMTRKELFLLNELVQEKNETTRESDNNTSYYKIISLTYDVDNIKDLRAKLLDKISKIELEISENNSRTFEIEL